MASKAFANPLPLRQLGGALLAAVFTLLPVLAANAADDAESVVRDLFEKTSGGLDALYKSNRIGDRSAIEQLIEQEILPSVDGERFSRRVFRHYWPQLVKAGRQQDAQQRVLGAIKRTYAVALSSYSGDTLSVLDINERRNSTVAKTRIRRPNGQTIQVDFSLQERDGRWLIEDMAVDGIVVSLTLFNSMKSVWDTQGMEAALASLATADANPK
jgi:ABC-type transporter MlaC component